MINNRYPIGLQSFQAIRDSQCIYADKTDLVYKLAHDSSKYFFLSRPRRFGKSLLISTLSTYFSGKKEYFKGLAIDTLEDEWTSYPVVRLDLSPVKDNTAKKIEIALNFILDREFSENNFDIPNTTLGFKLNLLIDKLYNKYQKPVVLLIDEYDSPMLNVLNSGTELESVRNLMRAFYGSLKSLEDRLRFVFLTGITKFSQLSLFSELNNLNDISMDPRYAALCGITEDELKTVFHENIVELAKALNLTEDEALLRLKNMYDGYHFCLPSPDIYNPISVLNCLNRKEFKTWWYETGTSAYLIEMLQKSPLDISALKTSVIQASSADFDRPTEAQVDPIALLYQAGYLTIKDYHPDLFLYDLAIPNQEVYIGLIKQLLPYFVGHDLASNVTFKSHIFNALIEQKPEQALSILQSSLAAIPYDLAAKNEKQFQAQLYILLSSLGIPLESEVRTSKGRIDFVLLIRGICYIIELKYAGSASAALKQIEEKNYALSYKHKSDHVYLIGANFDPATRTLSDDWEIKHIH